MSELTIVLKLSLQEPGEPREDRVEAEHALARGTAAAQVVRPVREADELDLSSEQAEPREELFSLLDGTAVILVRVEQ